MYGLETMVWRAWWWVEERIGSVVWTLFFYRQLTDDACGVWRTWKPTLASFSIRLRARRWTAFSTPSKLGEPFFNAHMASIDVTTTDEPNAAKQQMFNRAGGRSFSAHNSRRLVGWKLLTFDLFEWFRRPFGAYLVVVVMVRRPTGRLMVISISSGNGRMDFYVARRMYTFIPDQLNYVLRLRLKVVMCWNRFFRFQFRKRYTLSSSQTNSNEWPSMRCAFSISFLKKRYSLFHSRTVSFLRFLNTLKFNTL